MSNENSNQVLYNILTERLDQLRAMDKEGDTDRRRHVARETKELHAPLAHRLGISKIKSELEDLALKHLDPIAYQEIAESIDRKREESCL